MRVKVKSLKECLDIDLELYSISVCGFKSDLENKVFYDPEVSPKGNYKLGVWHVPMNFCETLDEPDDELAQDLFVLFMNKSGVLK